MACTVSATSEPKRAQIKDQEGTGRISNHSTTQSNHPTVLSHNHDQDQCCSTDDHDVERMQWSGRFDFVLSCIGYAVGLGNAWRFPYMVFKHGGGAFMLPYTVFLIFGGVPLVFLEIGLGQYSSLGPLQVWRCVPLFKGVGVCMVLVSCAVAVYYNVILSWVTFFLFSSMQSPLPWSSCNNTWNTPACCEILRYQPSCAYNLSIANSSCLLCLSRMDNSSQDIDNVFPVAEGHNANMTFRRQVLTSPTEEYFMIRVLAVSQDFYHFGNIEWKHALSLLFVWVAIFGALSLGVRSAGKVIYVTSLLPFVLLLVLLVFACTLPGAVDGVIFYLKPEWHNLRLSEVWTDAASQALLSLGPGYGAYMTIASYTKFSNNCFRDTILVAVINTMTNLLAGFAAFCTLGHIAHSTGVSIKNLLSIGPELGLIFITYPSVFIESTIASNFFGVSFFLMLLLLGIDTQFVHVNTIVTAFVDMAPKKLSKYRIIILFITCTCLYFLGFSFLGRNGLFLLELMESYITLSPVLIIALLESGAVGWVYGTKRFQNDIYVMTGVHIGFYWVASWRFFIPIIILCLLISNLISEPTSSLIAFIDAAFPSGSWIVAICIDGLIVLITIVVPLCLFIHKKGSVKERLKFLLKAPYDWGVTIDTRYGSADLVLPEYMISEKEEPLEFPKSHDSALETAILQMSGNLRGTRSHYMRNEFMEQDNIDTGSVDWSEDENAERGNWSGRYDFVISSLGYSVGIGNVWRFPYVVYKNGGGAFFIPYILMLVLCGIPLFFMEVAVGQFASLGPISVWKVCPIFKGVGVAAVMSVGYVAIYYNVMNSWSVYFIFASMTAELPWTHCNNTWNTDSCRLRDNISALENLWQPFELICDDDNSTINTCYNATTNSSRPVHTSPSEEYFLHEVMGLSGGIEHMGGLQWHLSLCLLFCWLVVFAALVRGVKSAGKVVYVTALFPYIILLVLFIRYATLESSAYLDGIKYYVTPNWQRLASAEVWADAASQLFFSLGISQGGLIALGSYNRFHYDMYRDTYIVCLVDTMTSVFAGFVIFAILGVMAQESGTDVEHVVSSKFTLAYVAFPEAVTRLPAAFIWAVLFFLMLFTLAVDTVFFMCEAIVVALMDEFQVLAKRRLWIIAALCLSFYLLGLPMVTQGGLYLVVLMDQYAAAWGPLIIGLCMCLSLAWVYKEDHFAANIRVMLGSSPGKWWSVMWRYVTPLSLVFILVFSWVQYSSPTLDGYSYPVWAHALAVLMGISSVLSIPTVAVINISRSGCAKILCKLKDKSRPGDDWGPALNKHRVSAFIPGIINTEDEIKLSRTAQWVAKASSLAVGVSELTRIFATDASRSMQRHKGPLRQMSSQSLRASVFAKTENSTPKRKKLKKKVITADCATQTEKSALQLLHKKQSRERAERENVTTDSDAHNDMPPKQEASNEDETTAL